MKRLLSLFILLFVSTIKCFSQDVIVLKTGEEIKARVSDVGLEIIKYKKYGNENGPSYSLEKSKVFMVKYENGTKDVFANSDKEKKNELRQDGDLKLAGNKAYLNGERIRGGELRDLLLRVPSASKTYNNGVALYYVGVGTSAIGAIVFCYKLSDWVINDDLDLGATIFGGGLLLTGIVLESVGVGIKKKGVNLYNGGRKGTVKLDFGVSSKGVGVAMKF